MNAVVSLKAAEGHKNWVPWAGRGVSALPVFALLMSLRAVEPTMD
jgi:hypothetical protein